MGYIPLPSRMKRQRQRENFVNGKSRLSEEIDVLIKDLCKMKYAANIIVLYIFVVIFLIIANFYFVWCLRCLMEWNGIKLEWYVYIAHLLQQ
jgi:hypothetical protein